MEASPEINADKINYKFKSRNQNTGQNNDTKIPENAASSDIWNDGNKCKLFTLRI
jgi:hypothetical protein